MNKLYHNAKDITGMRFGKLVAVAPSDKRLDRHIIWECVCDCGTICFVSGASLRKGLTLSCGCYMSEVVHKNNIKYKMTHNLSQSRPYNIWKLLLQRCYNKKHKSFKDYGGRGISVCERWNDFSLFWEDMKENYSDTLTIDRIDNDGNYCKENCMWATQIEQSKNKRDNVYIEINGETKILKDWVRYYDINMSTYYHRTKSGMSQQEALTKIGKRKRYANVD